MWMYERRKSKLSKINIIENNFEKKETKIKMNKKNSSSVIVPENKTKTTEQKPKITKIRIFGKKSRISNEKISRKKTDPIFFLIEKGQSKTTFVCYLDEKIFMSSFSSMIVPWSTWSKGKDSMMMILCDWNFFKRLAIDKTCVSIFSINRHRSNRQKRMFIESINSLEWNRDLILFLFL